MYLKITSGICYNNIPVAKTAHDSLVYFLASYFDINTGESFLFLQTDISILEIGREISLC